jgi:hypothetical protein
MIRFLLLFNALMSGDTSQHDTPAHLAAGPSVSRELRPGETLHGPATGKLAIGGLVPEHQHLAAGTIPTLNAPGVGSDTGLKRTADNPDARAGDGGHAAGVDPADPGTTGDQRTAPERHDTAEENAERATAMAELEASIQRGEVPSRDLFLRAGCPEAEVDKAIESAQHEIDARKGGNETVLENREAAAATASSPAGEPVEKAPAAVSEIASAKSTAAEPKE